MEERLKEKIEDEELKKYEECIATLEKWKSIVDRARKIVFSIDSKFRKEVLGDISLLGIQSNDPVQQALAKYIDERLESRVNQRNDNDFNYIPVPEKVSMCLDMLKSVLLFDKIKQKHGKIDELEEEENK